MGVDKSRAENTRQIEEALTVFVDRGEVPGYVASVYHRGEVILVEAGRAVKDSDQPIAIDSIFRISSMSKPITAVATLVLAERGQLSLDDPVEKYLPELSQRQVLVAIDGPVDATRPATRPFTVKDLLTFTFGFGALFNSCPIVDAASSLGLAVTAPQPQSAPAPDEWLRRLGTLPLMYQPGERWMYHTGADLLGVLISRVSGQRYSDFLAENIFSPLSMKDTGFFVPPASMARFGACYHVDDATSSLVVFDPPTGQWSVPPKFDSGGAGLVSTAADYLRFACMMLRGGAPLLTTESVRAMTTDQLTSEQKAVSGFGPGFFDATGWGYGVSVVTRATPPAPFVGQYGWSGGLGTLWFNDPSRDIAAVLLTNVMWSTSTPPPICTAFSEVVNTFM